LDFSKDGAWVAYVAYPDGTLWKSKPDGTQRIQLTSPPLYAYLPRWSPDGKHIAFADIASSTHRSYMISAGGGNPEPLAPETPDADCPDWSPDGNSLVMSRRDLSSAGLLIVDWKTRKVSTLPGSKSLLHPRWSPDGRYIAGTDREQLIFFDLKTQAWTTLAAQGTVFTNWSHDGSYIYFDSPRGEGRSVFRVRVADRKVEHVVSLSGIEPPTNVEDQWVGLAPDDSILVLRDISSREIYALDWEAP
jgi:Tol biopolymer transport system component